MSKLSKMRQQLPIPICDAPRAPHVTVLIGNEAFAAVVLQTMRKLDLDPTG
jgi:hypothetical protein